MHGETIKIVGAQQAKLFVHVLKLNMSFPQA
jgi:hypothetical protein